MKRASGMIALAALALAILAPLAPAAASPSGAYARLAGHLLVIGNDFFTARFNLSAGASLILYEVLGSTLLKCGPTAGAGLHPSFHTVRASNYSLSMGPWKAVVAINTSDKVVVYLSPRGKAAEAVEPLDLKVVMTVTRDKPYLLYTLLIKNPTNSTVNITSDEAQGLGVTLAFGACRGPWTLYALYGNASDYHLSRSRPSSTFEGITFPVNASLISAALVNSTSGTPKVSYAFILGGPLRGYAAVMKDNTTYLYAFTEIKAIPPKSLVSLSFKAGIVPSNPLLLSLAGLEELAYKVEGGSFIDSSTRQANYETELFILNTTLNNYKVLYNSCKANATSLASKLGEVEELYNTCKVNLGIAKNTIAEKERLLKSAAARTTGFTIAGVVVGVIGGYLAARAALERRLPARRR